MNILCKLIGCKIVDYTFGACFSEELMGNVGRYNDYLCKRCGNYYREWNPAGALLRGKITTTKDWEFIGNVIKNKDLIRPSIYKKYYATARFI